jgi:hypothetical protein
VSLQYLNLDEVNVTLENAETLGSVLSGVVGSAGVVKQCVACRPLPPNHIIPIEKPFLSPPLGVTLCCSASIG